MDNRGLTLVELLLSVALLLIIISGITTFNSSWYLNNNLDSAKNILVSSIRKSQEHSLSKKNNLTWGVCLTTGKIRMYGGSCSSPTIKDDYSVPSSITITGLSDFSFSPLRGEPSSPQNISLSSGGKTYTVSINQVGGIIIN